jgi:DNA polymerase III epsilon subunit-like protein
MRSDHEAWAKEVLADPKTVVLDTETTGLRGYVCEISVYDGTAFLLDTLVNPEAPIEPGAARVHGLTATTLADAPVFGKVWPALEGIMADRRIVVWNAEFDAGVIQREALRLADPDRNPPITMPACRWECAMRHYSDWYRDMEDARFVRLNGGHRAGQDCKAVFDRLREMAG